VIRPVKPVDFQNTVYYINAILINMPVLSLKEKQMAHKITEECINCGACIAECPVEAITEGEEISTIDPEICTDCGACVEVCPVDAIVEA